MEDLVIVACSRRFTYSASLILIVLLSAGCMNLFGRSPEVPGGEDWGLDFDTFVAHGQGWSVSSDSSDPEVIQDRPSGGIARILFQGTELPARFMFEAELGVIDGDNPNDRPYFALSFNKQYEGQGGARIPGYQFAFRPSQSHYELVKVNAGGTEILASHDDVMPPWAWDLEEWRTFRVVRDGSQIEVYLNNDLVISFTDNEYTGGYVGFWTYSTAAVFRNIKLEALD